MTRKDPSPRIEGALQGALSRSATGGPPRLAEAMRYAVFPGGARIRPRLCLAVAEACGKGQSDLAAAAAASIEFLHCASLVHDDLPCFDAADTRRGKPSVHRAFGEPLAVLAGDALIVLAFECVAQAATASPARLSTLIGVIAAAAGAPHGIAAGQAWECEPVIELSAYQRAKTGALFGAATMAGAAAAGAPAAPWRMLGETLGEAFQVADDLRDVVCSAAEIGKPIGRDEALGRPSAVGRLGIPGAVKLLERLIAEAMACIPSCPGRAELQDAIAEQTRRFMPRELQREPA